MQSKLLNTSFFLFTILATLCVSNTLMAKPAKPHLSQYDSCDGGNGNPPRQLDFPSVKKALIFFPKLLDKTSSKAPFKGEGSFNLACGGTALSGQIVIKPTKKNRPSTIFVRTCGDLAVQTEDEACSVVYDGQYQPIMTTVDGEKMVLKYNRIFFVNKTGTIESSYVYIE